AAPEAGSALSFGGVARQGIAVVNQYRRSWRTVPLDVHEVAQREFEPVHPVDESEIDGQAAEFRPHIVSGEVFVARRGMYARAGGEPLRDVGLGVDADRARFLPVAGGRHPG